MSDNPLKEMAALAVKSHIKGSTLKRNSILKPFDMILQNLEREPGEEVRDWVRSGSQQQIFDHLDRINTSEFKIGRGKQEQLKEYVSLFFDELLGRFHKGDVNHLLQRTKILRSAYLLYFYEALPVKEKEQAEKEQSEEQQQMDLDD